MKKIHLALIAAAVFTVGAVPAQAQLASANHDVAFEVQAITSLSLSGTPSLTISAAVAGSAPTQASSTGVSYDITTNESNVDIWASIDTDMPTGVTLKANLTAPTGGSVSNGAVALSTEAAQLVSGISTLNQSGKSIVYTLDATSSAAVVSSSRTVTYTVLAGA